ncbi:MAG: hypothetical protein IT159_10800 [Bryobacterales bacterium]|nr:hypothetical protein [Bryobacterales bacterium]
MPAFMDCRRTSNRAARRERLRSRSSQDNPWRDQEPAGAAVPAAAPSTLETERRELLRAVTGRLRALPANDGGLAWEACLDLLSHLAGPAAAGEPPHAA